MIKEMIYLACARYTDFCAQIPDLDKNRDSDIVLVQLKIGHRWRRYKDLITVQIQSAKLDWPKLCLVFWILNLEIVSNFGLSASNFPSKNVVFLLFLITNLIKVRTSV